MSFPASQLVRPSFQSREWASWQTEHKFEFSPSHNTLTRWQTNKNKQTNKLILFCKTLSVEGTIVMPLAQDHSCANGYYQPILISLLGFSHRPVDTTSVVADWVESWELFFRQEVHPVTLSAKPNHSERQRLNWYPKRRLFRSNLKMNTTRDAELRRRHYPLKRLVFINRQTNGIDKPLSCSSSISIGIGRRMSSTCTACTWQKLWNISKGR